MCGLLVETSKKRFSSKIFFTLSSPGLWSYWRNPVWTNLPCRVWTNSNSGWLFLYFSSSPGTILFSLCNCCYVWTHCGRFSSVMKLSSYFWHRHWLFWVCFFHIYWGFSFSTRLCYSEWHLTVVPLRVLWCIFRSLLHGSIASLRQGVNVKDVCCIYLI